jgi:hypothetical protein
MKNGFLILFIFILNCVSAFSQSKNNYLEDPKNSTIVQKSENKLIDNHFKQIEMSDWLGQKIMFMPKSEKLREYGYQGYKLTKSSGKTITYKYSGNGIYEKYTDGILIESNLRNDSIPYAEYVGKISTIQSVGKVEAVTAKVNLVTEDGEEISTTSFFNCLKDIVFINDIDTARNLFLGKNLWLKNKGHVLGKKDGQTVEVKSLKWDKILVKNIVSAEFDHCPIRFIVVTPSGEEGYLDLNLSNTNVSKSLQEFDHFSDRFFESDPKIKYSKFSKKIISAIMNQKALIGMTREQAKLSWGIPNDINVTRGSWGVHEQWVYGNSSYLYFKNGILSSVQE